ncbi:zinc finger BED domain-containing protein RICESLEEPER 2-like [Tripterygium wilfordii]|uniref:zinc finger BED domain-containing protein RICESLEEPER 2-like n=1 Tax=Tripterygium wilfordii TaxID=458696 RepID=UPI0018F8518A|nr:zinc finger BED domain-containing protein RICESLEEPER 2-like [Tripterygium wilfordii]
MVITAHFIDSDWNLQKKIINFGSITSHRGKAIGRVIENCLKDWEIKKLFTIIVDNASSNDHLVNYLKRRFASIALGNYVHMRCVAHIINLVVSEGMKETIDSINQVRDAIKFIQASSARIHKFKECVEMERIKSKSLLCLDVCTRWNLTFLMLEAAQKFEHAFERFEELEPHIMSELSVECGMSKQEDWSKVRRFVTFLRYFYELTLKASGTSYVTSNHFFHDLNILYYVLHEMKGSNDAQMSSMANRMIAKCEKYWGGGRNLIN